LSFVGVILQKSRQSAAKAARAGAKVVRKAVNWSFRRRFAFYAVKIRKKGFKNPFDCVKTK